MVVGSDSVVPDRHRSVGIQEKTAQQGIVEDIHKGHTRWPSFVVVPNLDGKDRHTED